jgi:hypothetical protein
MRIRWRAWPSVTRPYLPRLQWAQGAACLTESWTNTSSELLENEAIKDQTAVVLVDRLHAKVGDVGSTGGGDVTLDLKARRVMRG